MLDLQVGDVISIFNNEDPSFLNATVKEKPSGMWYEGKSTILVEPIKALGMPTGMCRIKAFRPLGQLDESRFVMVEGESRLKDSFLLKNDGNTVVAANNGSLGLYNLKEPTDDHHAATAGYVEGKIETVNERITDGEEIQSELQAKVAALEGPEGAPLRVRCSVCG